MGDETVTYRQKSGGAWKVTAALGVAGLLGSAYFYTQGGERFAFSYLFGFFTCLTVCLGAMFFVLIQHLTKAHWGLTTRRTGEFFMAGMPVLFILFLPIAFVFQGDLYAEWADLGHGGDHAAESGDHHDHDHDHDHDHGDDHAEEGQTAHTPYEAALHHSLLEEKSGWLNMPFWLGRALFYFLLWLLISLSYFRWSTSQDEEKDRGAVLAASQKMQKWSALSIVTFALTLTFASFDWIMALEAAWYSTIYGVCMFASSVVAIFALVTFIHLRMKANGDLGDVVSVEHFHDLGKLLFGFICFWAYVNFSQFILIWYAGFPEEATYYQMRGGESGWGMIGMLLMLGFFALPFFTLISRVPKRRLQLLQLGCVWMLIMHVVNMYWLVVPNAGQDLGEGILGDASALLFCAGVYGTFVFRKFGKYPLIPIGDPRLGRCLTHVQTQ